MEGLCKREMYQIMIFVDVTQLCSIVAKVNILELSTKYLNIETKEGFNILKAYSLYSYYVEPFYSEEGR